MNRATIAANATTCPNCGGTLARVRYCDDVVACRACRETWYACEVEPLERDAAFPVALCPRCTDETACDDHEVRP